MITCCRLVASGQQRRWQQRRAQGGMWDSAGLRGGGSSIGRGEVQRQRQRKRGSKRELEGAEAAQASTRGAGRGSALQQQRAARHRYAHAGGAACSVGATRCCTCAGSAAAQSELPHISRSGRPATRSTVLNSAMQVR